MTACRTPWKIPYVSRREAAVDARKIRKQLRGTLRPYRCGCGFWHLTSMSTTAVRRLRKRKAALAAEANL